MKVKIIVTGPFGAGKTQFIRTISEIDPVLTEQKTKNKEESQKKDFKTVGMDFGKVTIDNDTVLYLFGTPGQDRFSLTWESLIKGVLGIVLLVDSTDINSIVKARSILDFFYSRVKIPYIVAANKQDLLKTWPIEAIKSYLDLDENVKILPRVAKDKESVKRYYLNFLR
ncbi:MAG: GTP-binding protein [Thermosulfidibacteraceae bacterium]|jgi:signal recognition particle receptor subunit beta